jgi:hypothetical protein
MEDTIFIILCILIIGGGPFYIYYMRRQVCSTNKIFRDGKCVDCPPNSRAVSNICSCELGYLPKDDTCIEQIICSEKQIYGPNNTCIDCPKYARNYRGYCECLFGHTTNPDGTCADCKAPKVLQSDGTCA